MTELWSSTSSNYQVHFGMNVSGFLHCVKLEQHYHLVLVNVPELVRVYQSKVKLLKFSLQSMVMLKSA